MNPMNQGKQLFERGTLNGMRDCEEGPERGPNRGWDAMGKPHVGSWEEKEHSDACDWKRAHNELIRLARDHAELEWEVGRWLLQALRAATPLRLGYASMAEYAHRLFGFDARFTSEKLRVAATLEELPQLSRALRKGELTWSAVRELTRVATPANEADWLSVARGRVSRDIERMVSGRRQGDGPDDPADKSIVKHVLRFEVRAETLALVREAQAKLRREAGGRLDDDAALLLMARQVLGGPKDAGRASYQISITKCDECRRAHVHASGSSSKSAPRCSRWRSVMRSVSGGFRRVRVRVRVPRSVPTWTPTATIAAIGRRRMCRRQFAGSSSIGTMGGARCPGVGTRTSSTSTTSSGASMAAITSPMGSSCFVAYTITPRTAASS
jgi:hypothetical protein